MGNWDHSAGFYGGCAIFAQECFLPIELSLESVRGVEWESVGETDKFRAQLLAPRAKWLERRPEARKEAKKALRRSQESSRNYHDVSLAL